jgi:hypothetical protein
VGSEPCQHVSSLNGLRGGGHDFAVEQVAFRADKLSSRVCLVVKAQTSGVKTPHADPAHDGAATMWEKADQAITALRLEPGRGQDSWHLGVGAMACMARPGESLGREAFECRLVTVGMIPVTIVVTAEQDLCPVSQTTARAEVAGPCEGEETQVNRVKGWHPLCATQE